MGDHTVSGYLKRQSVAELRGILYYCLREENYDNYAYAIPLILEELNGRFAAEDASEQALWVRQLLRKYHKTE